MKGVKAKTFSYKFKPQVVRVGMDTSKMTHEQWQDYRTELVTLGGSDIGAALGLSKYTSNVELFYKKLGLYQKDFGYRLPMALGNQFEPIMRDAICFFDYDEETFAENLDKRRIQHKTRNEKHTLYPLDWPMLHIHLDGLIRMNGKRGTGNLELKWQSQFVLDMWDAGISPEYLAQTLIATHALGMDYGVLGIFTGNHGVNVHVIDKSEELVGQWRPILQDFWSRLTAARQVIKQAREITPNISEEMLYTLVEQYEPTPHADGEEPWMNFMSERAKMLAMEETMEAGAEHIEKAEDYKDLTAEKKDAEGRLKKIKAFFMDDMLSEGASKIDFGEMGSITWREGSNGKRVMRFNLK